MQKRKKVSRQQILQTGLSLMSQQGLAGVTIGQLAEQVGMSKSGVFAHFRSKEEVELGILDFMGELALTCFVAPTLAAPAGLPRLEVLVRRWFGWPKQAGLPGGCPGTACMFELDDMVGPVRDKIVAMEKAWRSLLEGWVREAVELEHLRADLDVDQFVWELISLYLGHHVSQRLLQDDKADRRAQQAFQALVERAKVLPSKARTLAAKPRTRAPQ